jgi:glycerophosphoryl diester phosphodiesterase
MPRAPRPLIVAHRGVSAHAPENTLPAFQMAIDAGADGIELDVRVSKDGIPVVVHDRNLRRLAGMEIAVSDLTADQLARVNVGSHFNKSHPGISRDEFARAGIPTLIQVLDFADAWNGTIHIELKIDKKREMEPLVQAVCGVIYDSQALPRIVLSSFRMTALAEAKHVLPSVRTSALFSPTIMRFLKRRRHMISLARAFGANEISPYRSLVTPKLGRTAREIGVPINIWTCNNVKWIDRALETGVNAVITNDPAKLISYRSQLDVDE